MYWYRERIDELYQTADLKQQEMNRAREDIQKEQHRSNKSSVQSKQTFREAFHPDSQIILSFEESKQKATKNRKRKRSK